MLNQYSLLHGQQAIVFTSLVTEIHLNGLLKLIFFKIPFHLIYCRDNHALTSTSTKRPSIHGFIVDRRRVCVCVWCASPNAVYTACMWCVFLFFGTCLLVAVQQPSTDFNGVDVRYVCQNMNIEGVSDLLSSHWNALWMTPIRFYTHFIEESKNNNRKKIRSTKLSARNLYRKQFKAICWCVWQLASAKRNFRNQGRKSNKPNEIQHFVQISDVESEFLKPQKIIVRLWNVRNNIFYRSFFSVLCFA